MCILGKVETQIKLAEGTTKNRPKESASIVRCSFAWCLLRLKEVSFVKGRKSYARYRNTKQVSRWAKFRIFYALWTPIVEDSLPKKPSLVRTLRNITQNIIHSHAAVRTFLLILSTIPILVSAKETTLIGRIPDIVRIRACGSDFVTLKEWGSGDGYVE
jgi:hypothetical protein